MIRINGEITASVKRLSLNGDRLTIHMENDLEKAIAWFGHVRTIEAEALDDVATYEATEGEAVLTLLQRMPRSDKLMIVLEGIDLAE